MNFVANYLLESKAVHIEPNPKNFFTWTSGKRSPIYCDNRQLISYPTFRKKIINEFCSLIKTKYSNVELIAGTATAGIPWAAWIADELNLPMVYIRSKPKGHGLKSAIEGHFTQDQNTLIIEDLISTGKSSIEAYTHAKQDGLNVLSVFSIFNYGFKEAKSNFAKNALNVDSLCSLDQLLDYANSTNILNDSDVKVVLNWKEKF
jgi:orotate phosphoribosyltransferase